MNNKTASEILRSSNRQDLLNFLALNFTNYMMEQGYFSTCLNCHHWKATEEMCGKFNARPPAKVIVSGCEEHTDVPF